MLLPPSEPVILGPSPREAFLGSLKKLPEEGKLILSKVLENWGGGAGSKEKRGHYSIFFPLRVQRSPSPILPSDRRASKVQRAAWLA